MCCFAVYKARLFVMEGSNPFVNEVKTFLCLPARSCPARTIKHVPALLQTAVSFHTPYSVNEMSSLLSCPGFRNINLRKPGSFWYVVYSWQ